MKKKSRTALFIATGGLSEVGRGAKAGAKAAGIVAADRFQEGATGASAGADDRAPSIAELAKTKIPGLLKTSYDLRREIRKLPGVLLENETVLNLAAGQHSSRRGLVAVTDRRVLFLDEGVGRHALDDYPYTQITGVESGNSLMRGYVVIHTAGSTAAINEIYPKARATEVADFIRTQIERVSTQWQPALGTHVASSPGDAYDELAKLGKLRDAGVLTSEEFEAKKAVLLERL